MANPYKELRIALGMTQEELAAESNVGRQIVLRTEICMYAKPPPAITKALVRGYPAPQMAAAEAVLQEGYEAHRRELRRMNKQLFLLSPGDWAKIRNSKSGRAWITFRRAVHLAQYGFAQLLAFDLATLQNYERDGTGWDTLELALSEVLPTEHLDQLRKAIYRGALI